MSAFLLAENNRHHLNGNGVHMLHTNDQVNPGIQAKRNWRLAEVSVSGCFRRWGGVEQFSLLRSHISTIRQQSLHIWDAVGSFFIVRSSFLNYTYLIALRTNIHLPVFLFSLMFKILPKTCQWQVLGGKKHLSLIMFVLQWLERGNS